MVWQQGRWPVRRGWPSWSRGLCWSIWRGRTAVWRGSRGWRRSSFSWCLRRPDPTPGPPAVSWEDCQTSRSSCHSWQRLSCWAQSYQKVSGSWSWGKRLKKESKVNNYIIYQNKKDLDLQTTVKYSAETVQECSVEWTTCKLYRNRRWWGARRGCHSPALRGWRERPATQC